MISEIYRNNLVEEYMKWHIADKNKPSNSVELNLVNHRKIKSRLN